MKSQITHTQTSYIERLKNERSSTFKHSLNVAHLTLAIYDELKTEAKSNHLLESEFNKLTYEDLTNGAIYHDIGKLMLPDEMLIQKKNLDKQERKLIETHPKEGYSLVLNTFKHKPNVLNSILYHHEHFDGSGYPQKNKKQEIPLAARIISIADQYDAMTHRIGFDENNKPLQPKTKQEAIHTITFRCAPRFDPDVMSAFLRVISR